MRLHFDQDSKASRNRALLEVSVTQLGQRNYCGKWKVMDGNASGRKRMRTSVFVPHGCRLLSGDLLLWLMTVAERRLWRRRDVTVLRHELSRLRHNA